MAGVKENEKEVRPSIPPNVIYATKFDSSLEPTLAHAFIGLYPYTVCISQYEPCKLKGTHFRNILSPDAFHYTPQTRNAAVQPPS